MYQLELFNGLNGEKRKTLDKSYETKEEAIEICDVMNKKLIANQHTVLARVLYFKPKEDKDKVIECYFSDDKSISWSDSVVDWKIHTDFFSAGKCFVCGRKFTKEESKLKGIGPVCGGWTYSDDKVDWQVVAEKMMNSYYYTSIQIKFGLNPENLEYLGPHNGKSIRVRDNASKKEFYLPRKGTIHANGIIYIAAWVRQIYWRNH